MSDGLNVEYVDNFYQAANEIMTGLSKLPFQSYSFTFYGKSYIPLRKMCAYGDLGLKYPFSGIVIEPNPWIPLLYQMKCDVEAQLRTNYNFALLNYYENGYAYISPHKDDENCMANIPIASLNFGATRKLIFRRNGYKPVIIPVKHGSLYIMKPPTNKLWTHEIPIEKDVTSPRISITFRHFKNNANLCI